MREVTDAGKARQNGAASGGHSAAYGRGGRRASFFLCCFAGLLLSLAALTGSVVYNATRLDLFEEGLDRYVVANGTLSRNDAERLAVETIGYLTGDQNEWEPDVKVNEQPLVIPAAFSEHMATVRGGVRFARSALVMAVAAALVLLLLCGLPDRNHISYRRLSPGGYYAGALLPLLAVLGLGLWASFDFNAFWAWLHYTFIPDGIFAFQEPVMALFPEPLFAGYSRPVGITLAFCTAVLMIWPVVALTIHRTRKRRLEKRMGTGNR